MTDSDSSDEVRDAQGKVIAIVNRRALHDWLHFGTIDPALSTFIADLRHKRKPVPKAQRPGSPSVSANTRKKNGGQTR